jgi:hypothetical protein
MVMSPAELGQEKDCAGEVRQQLQIIDPPSRQRERPILTKSQLSKIISRKKKIKIGDLTLGQTGRLTVGHKITLTLT